MKIVIAKALSGTDVRPLLFFFEWQEIGTEHPGLIVGSPMVQCLKILRPLPVVPFFSLSRSAQFRLLRKSQFSASVPIFRIEGLGCDTHASTRARQGEGPKVGSGWKSHGLEAGPTPRTRSRHESEEQGRTGTGNDSVRGRRWAAHLRALTDEDEDGTRSETDCDWRERVRE